jgi:hypothetical protein
MEPPLEIIQKPEFVAHTQILLNSFRRWTGRELFERGGTPEEEARRLAAAPFVVVAHGTESDPVLNYANATALKLWAMSWEQFTRTPSRLTAEPLHRDERARLMAQVTAHGFIDNYRGVRIASTGQRFMIEQAIVWNLIDAQEKYVGQAATFSSWQNL